LIFSRVCQQCHRLFGSGGDQGPDLTGSDRGDLDFLLLQVVDPSRMVGEPYRTTIVTTTDQRTIAGVVVAEDHESIRIKTGTGTYVLTRREIAERTQLRTSAMPEGLLSHLDESQIRDLVAYLQSREQVPLRESE
jgi:putative heme-binding domain-containing protein